MQQTTNPKDRSVQFTGVSTEQDYVNIAQSAKICGCTMKTENFLQDIHVSGTKRQMQQFNAEMKKRC